MEPNKNKSIIKTILIFIYSAMYKHLIPIYQNSDMTFSCRWLVSLVVDAFKLGPYLVGDGKLVEIIVAFTVATSAKD
jgi:hypothetical protein